MDETITCTLGEVPTNMDKLIEEYGVDFDWVENDDGLLSIDKVAIVVPELGLKFRTGSSCGRDLDGDIYVNYSVTLIYNLDERNAEKYISVEPDSLEVCLFNKHFAGIASKLSKDLQELKAEIVLWTDEDLPTC